LLLLKQKHIRIIIGIAIALAVFAIIYFILSATGHEAKKQSAVNEIKSTGLINIGLRGDLNKLCTYDEESGQFEGFEKDVADEIASRLFGDEILVNYVLVNTETRAAYLRRGDIDIGLGAATNLKESNIIYSVSYFSDGSAFLVMEENTKSMEALSGGRIAVVYGTTHAQKSEDNEDETLMSDYLKILDIEATVKEYASYPEAVQALRDGFVDAVCASETALTQFGMAGMLLLPERFMPSEYRICVSRSKGLFLEAVDDTLSAMKQDGTLDTLMKKWNLVNYQKLEEQ
jgi:putative glutamine transport system substrate-binding protein